MRKFFQEFKDFALKSNVIDLAVAVIIGNAVNNIVNSLVRNIFMPIIGIFVGRIDVQSLKFVIPSRITHESDIIIRYGEFLQAVLDFLTTAFCIFLILKLFNKIKTIPTKLIKSINENDVKEEEEERKPEPPKTEELLVEIRDILKERSAAKEKSNLPDYFEDEH